MKITSLLRRLLAVALVLTLLCSVLLPAGAAQTDEPDKVADSSFEELPLTPVDPDTLAPHQLDLAGDEEAPDPADDYAPEEVVRVSIVLNKPSTIEAGYALDGIAENSAARAYRSRLKAEQTTVTKRIESATGSKLDVRWNLTLAANIISAEIPYGQIEAIKALDGISDVFLESRYDPQTDEDAAVPDNGAASTMIGSQLAWAQGYTGASSRIAIIDTGVDTSHQSFSAEGLEYAFEQNAGELGMSYDDYVASLDLLTADGIDAVLDQLNAAHVNSGTALTSGAQAYRNTKVAFGYNYVDTTPNEIEHIHDTQGNHGSRVAGVAVANRYVKSEGIYQPALDVAGMQGVAPDAQLVVMKVFGSHGGAYSSDYMSAIEDAIVLGCDAANLSLGSSSPGFSFSDDYEYVLNEIVQSGMVVSNSAGNSGMWYRTPNNENMTKPYLYTEDNNYFTSGSPGTYTNSLSVAAAENGGHTGYPLRFGDRNVYFSETSGYTNESIATLAGGEYGYVLLDNVGVTGEEGGDYFAQLGSGVLNGKFAICRRGTSSFSVKANAAMAQGAAGLIVINNEAGLVNMKLSDYTYTNPAVSISLADGDAVMAQSESHTAGGGLTYYTGTLSIAAALTVNYAETSDTINMYSNSSYGTPGSMVLKPEILAPGGSIYSSDGQYDDGGGADRYAHSSGTSLAAPQIAGMAGVLGQYIRENDLCTQTGLTQRQLINSLLMSTAHPVFDADGNYWPVFRVGAGLANINDALNAKAYVLMDEDATLFPDSARDGKVKAELGDDPAHTGEYEFSFTVYPLDNDRAYTFRTELFTQAIAGDFGYGLLQDTATARLGAEVTYEIGGSTYADDYVLNADVNLDGATDDADAQTILDYLTGILPGSASFDAAAADVDGDGSITTRDAWKILDADATPSVEISGPVKVTVHIKLDPDEMAALLQSFPNGFYVEGYTYLLSVDDGEGAMDVTHSIPIYGYCGSWTDANMLDRTSPVDEAYGTGKEPYTGVKTANYMSVISAQGSSVIYAGNPYEVEISFPTERLAMNSSRYINSFTYLNIRNVATIGFAVTAKDGSVLYAQATPIQKYGAYYYSDGGTWRNTGSASYTVGKTLNQMGAQEGDRVTVGFYALPEYYGIRYAKMNDTVATSGKLDTEGFTAVLNAGIVGENAGIKYSVVIDNTAPEISAVELDSSGTDLSVSCSDNNYVAWVALLNQSGSVVYASDVPSQPGPGEPVDFHFDLTDLDLPGKVTVLVADYAGNETAYLVQIKEEEPTPPACFAFTSASGAPGSGNRVLDIDIATLTYNDQTQAYEGLGVYSETPFVVRAADLITVVRPWTLTEGGLTFVSGNDGIASVSEDGAVTGVGTGNTTITVSTKAEPHLTATIPVNVSNSTGGGGSGDGFLHAPSMGALPAIVRAVENSTTVDDNTVTVVLTEDQDVNNGLIKITGFDAELTLVSAVSTLPYYSISTDTDAIVLAYASAEAIPTGTPLVTLTFSYESFGIDTEIDTETLERNCDLGLTGETTAIPIQKLHVHTYGPVEWVWSTDYTAATAKFTCACGNVEEIPAAVEIQTTAPDCTTGGQAICTASARFNSTDYSDTKTVDLDPLGHAYASVVTPPTCTTAGFTTYACSRCGHQYTGDETSALGHDWNDGETTIAASCTGAGLKTFTCKRCGVTKTEAISANGHTPRTVAAIPATCTTAGQTAGKDCSVCGAILEGMELVLPTGHTPVIDEAVAATCTATGLTAGTHCSVCGEVLVAQTEIPALGHKSEVIPAVAPTCTETGLTEGAKCSVCGEIQTEQVEIAALGHTVVIVPAVAATCTEAGQTEGSYCSVCGEVLTAQEPVEALGHAWTDIRYEWSEDGRLVTATATCEHDPSHTLSETAEAQFILTQPSTIEKTGTGCCLASFEESVFETQIRFVTIPEVACDGGDTCPSRDFTDVPPITNYAHIPIDWAILNQITLGMTPTTFSPTASCTRAQVVTFLWRLNGQPEPESKKNPFTDVKEGDYFYTAVLWAVEKGITEGTSATTFSPDLGCTRAQVVTFLWRAEGKPEPTSSLNPFTDVKADGYYYTAVLWAVENKITTGTSAVTFSPDLTCNRAQIVTFLYRAFAKEDVT